MRQGYLKTLEAVIAIVILFSFLTVILPRQNLDNVKVPSDVSLFQDAIFSEIESSSLYRSQILRDDVEGIHLFINKSIPEGMNYNLTLCKQVPCTPLIDIPTKTVYARSLIISSNLTEYNTRLLTLYLWKR